MGTIVARLIDPAEIRLFEGRLSVDAVTADVAARSAELCGLPAVDPHGRPVNYALMVKGGSLLDHGNTIAEHDLPDEVELRLLPEVVVGSEEPHAAAAGESFEESLVVIGPPSPLLPNTEKGGRPQVRIDVDVHREIADFAGRDRNNECAGLLLGDMSLESGERVVHIRAAIPAVCAPATRATVRITHQCWESMMQERDDRFAEMKLVGWFHTHPGWGVFMSELDVFIHTSFFNHPNHVSYVLDPTTGRDGFFAWQDSTISLLPAFTHVGAAVTPCDRPLPSSGVTARRPDFRDAAIVALSAAVIYLGVTRPANVDRVPNRPVAAVESPARPSPPVVEEPQDRVYVIAPGDNPWSICQRVYGNGALAEALVRYNNLDDVSGLQIGQQIKLPPKEKLEATTAD